MKTEPCTLGKKHKWNPLRNVTINRNLGYGRIQISQRGLYACDCGCYKYGVIIEVRGEAREK